MKTCTKRIATALLALLVLFSGILALTASRPQKADANAAEAATAQIYYFTDYYPTIPYEELESKFGGLQIAFVHDYIDVETFNLMVEKGYFSQYMNSSVVVMDIKTFMPEPDYLEKLFGQLKSSNNRTMYISAYDLTDFPDLRFMGYVDEFICDKEMSTLSYYLKDSLNNYTSMDKYRLYDTAYLIDSNLIPLHTQQNWDRFQKEGIVYLCRYSPLLRRLLLQIGETTPYGNLPNEYDYNAYEDLAAYLYDRWGVSFLACMKDGIYVNLLTRQMITLNDVGTFMNEAGRGINSLCAFGFWTLSEASYQSWSDIQHDTGKSVPAVYILEVDEIIHNPNGLMINYNPVMTYFAEDRVARMALDRLGSLL